jgi:hypothetical protein
MLLLITLTQPQPTRIIAVAPIAALALKEALGGDLVGRTFGFLTAQVPSCHLAPNEKCDSHHLLSAHRSAFDHTDIEAI